MAPAILTLILALALVLALHRGLWADLGAAGVVRLALWWGVILGGGALLVRWLGWA
ncbi:MAG: hypothetical protein NZM40_00055 [Sphingomonadaceae bacterium]|uniref:hypothetical protein n=1 Tax=Thermaurantiacus sp. TaxID=2820283 RepID=UPI00298F0344|nr:hypothetical protein [Thermaurantiacus sp.]MCS6985834.1 hypothetical protein [Sphingomonadaceae bacterium]MDW8413897.1 hypothetical protein [Thermaurantiacus sp.]